MRQQITALALLAVFAGCLVDDQTGEDGPEKPTERIGPVGEIPEHSTTYAKIKNLLESNTVSLDFKDTPLSAVIHSLREQSGAEIIADPVVFSTKTEDELMVNLMVDEIPLGEALNLIVSLKGLFLSVDWGYLLITTEQALPGDEWRVIDVRDLMVSLDTCTVDIKLRSGPEETMPPMMEDEEDDRMTGSEIISLVRKEVPSGNWNTWPNQISFRQGILIVRNRAYVIEQVLDLLKSLRERR